MAEALFRQPICCPLCDSEDTLPTGYQHIVPAMQNRRYRTRQEALDAPRGIVSLYTCGSCGLVFNAAFDPSLVTYDLNYQAEFETPARHEYLLRVASFINALITDPGGLIVEIACGSGDLLALLVQENAGIRALGIDPSYDGSSNSRDRLEFINEAFHPEHIAGRRPTLILCRHAFDQIAEPGKFLAAVRRSVLGADVGFFIELADLEWMLANRATEDLGYERRALFTAECLINALERGGYTVRGSARASNGQHLWVYGTIPKDNEARHEATLSICSRHEDIVAYAKTEDSRLDHVKERLREISADGYRIVVWGIATRGVNFCNFVDPDGELIDMCVDANPDKWGCFVPGTGHRITSPASGTDTPKLAVVIMNPNYLDEIGLTCRTSCPDVIFIDSSGNAMYPNTSIRVESSV